MNTLITKHLRVPLLRVGGFGILLALLVMQVGLSHSALAQSGTKVDMDGERAGFTIGVVGSGIDKLLASTDNDKNILVRELDLSAGDAESVDLIYVDLEASEDFDAEADYIRLAIENGLTVLVRDANPGDVKFFTGVDIEGSDVIINTSGDGELEMLFVDESAEAGGSKEIPGFIPLPIDNDEEAGAVMAEEPGETLLNYFVAMAPVKGGEFDDRMEGEGTGASRMWGGDSQDQPTCERRSLSGQNVWDCRTSTESMRQVIKRKFIK